MVAIYPIVEGHGEVQAVPVLFRRIAGEICQRYDVDVLTPYRVPRGSMLAHDSRALDHAVELGVRKIGQTEQSGAIIILLDADDECPAELGPGLLERIQREDATISVVVANREYEAWFLAGAASLAQRNNVKNDAVAPQHPEAIRDAKGYLERHILVDSATYRETVDQPSLTADVNLIEARAAPSFDKLCRDFSRVIAV